MSFGFRASNAHGYVQIDAEAPRLCMLTRGGYVGEGSAYATFSHPIDSFDPPLVFVRPDQGGPVQVAISIWFTGGPGAWTGFAMNASHVYGRLSGQYFAAAWTSTGASAFGMRLWGSNGALVYDSGAPAVAVTFAAGNWNYHGSEQLTVGRRYIWAIDKYLGANEFISLNPFAMHCHNPATGGGCALSVDYPAGQIRMYSLATTAWTDQGHRPFLCAKLVA